MGELRRVVIDTSAMIPAFFADRDRRVVRRALEIFAGIDSRSVFAFAPDMLQAEFLKRAARRRDELVSAGHDLVSASNEVEGQWLRFLGLRIDYTPASFLAATAWDVTCRHGVSAPDSWFVACARHHDAELWLSHPPRDSAGEHARRYGVDVHYLSREKFSAA